MSRVVDIRIKNLGIAAATLAGLLCVGRPSVAQPDQTPEEPVEAEDDTEDQPEKQPNDSEVESSEKVESAAAIDLGEDGDGEDGDEAVAVDEGEKVGQAEQTDQAAKQPPKTPHRERRDGVEDTKKIASKESPAQKPAKPRIDYSNLPITYHQRRVDVGAAYQLLWITDPAFDLLSEDNVQSAFRPHAAFAFWAEGPLSLAATLHYDVFTANGEARTLPTFLNFHRFLLGAEARYHLHPRLYGYGRLNVGPTFVRSRLGGESDVSSLHLKRTGFSGALNVGTAVRIAGSRDGRERAFRVHLFAEGGLSFVSAVELRYEPSEGGALRSDPVELGNLSLGGPQLVFGAMVSL